MTEFVKHANAPVAVEGWPIVGASTFVAIVFWAAMVAIPSDQFPVAKWTLGSFALLGTAFVAFSLWFFRNPERYPASVEPGAVISSADGTVLKVEKVNDPRYGAPAQKVSIFMSPLNVHVNRSPVSGVVERVEYVPGKFFAANLDKASTDNERNLVVIKSDEGHRIAFLQIAGFIARRIVCHVRAGDRLRVGQRYGMIRFGSRMEIFLPENSQVRVKKGDAIQAGHTVVAVISS